MELNVREKRGKEEKEDRKQWLGDWGEWAPSTLHVNWRTGVEAGSRRLITGATETDHLHTHTTHTQKYTWAAHTYT